MSAICIIPARGGSIRIKGKNKRLFYGKPIVLYSIEVAQKSGLFDVVVVTTDDDEIADISSLAGAVVLRRSDSLSKNEVGTQEVMADTLSQLEDSKLDGMTFRMPYKYACCIYPTAPMLSHKTLVQAHDFLIASGNDYVVPVGTWLRDPGQFYFGRAQAFLKNIPLLSERTGLLPIPANTDCDINTIDDWVMAEKMYLALQPSVCYESLGGGQ